MEILTDLMYIFMGLNLFLASINVARKNYRLAILNALIAIILAFLIISTPAPVQSPAYIGEWKNGL